jgi:hypothetical protein
MTDFRALCAELLKALSEWALGQGSNVDAPLIIRARALLAQPEPQGPDLTACDLLERFIDCFWDEQDAESYPNAAALVAQARALLAQPEPQGPTVMQILALSDEIEAEELGTIDLVRRALARWGRPAIEPVPQQEDVHYAWELHDAEGEWQAGGAANSLEDVQREGNRYLQTYAQDGPHKLIIERHCVTTIEPVPKREAEQ